MRILAIETTERAGTVAALIDEQLLVSIELGSALRSAQTLAPGIGAVVAAAGWRPADVELVAVAAGPGSFTGLRIGITTAKMFAYAVGAEVLGINTLEVIASQIPATGQRLWTVLDAQREQVFAGQFAATDNGWLWHGQTTLLDNESWLAQRSLGDLVAGPALAKLADLLPKSVQIIDRALWNPTAVSVGRIAFRQFAAGRRDDLWQLTPQYFRRSAAEEKRLQAQFSPNNQ